MLSTHKTKRLLQLFVEHDDWQGDVYFMVVFSLFYRALKFETYAPPNRRSYHWYFPKFRFQMFR